MSNTLSKKIINSWLGKLQLNFAIRKGRSVLTKCKHIGPFYVKKSFYSENDNTTPHVYLLHPPGGLVGGDKLVLDVTLESGSRALLTTIGASKFYRTNGLYAINQYTFKLKHNTALEWVPQSSIFFPRTKAKIDTTFIMEQGARLISFEMLFFGNLSLDDAMPKEVNIFLDINLSHSVGLRERFHINELDCSMKLGGLKISALLFAVPSDEKILNKVRKLIESLQPFQVGGATLLDEILVVRLLGNDAQRLKNLLCHIWYIIRPFIIGKEVVIPRIWFT